MVKYKWQRLEIKVLTQLSDTYQVVTQTRWMRPDAKRASRRQRRTVEVREVKEKGGQNITSPALT